MSQSRQPKATAATPAGTSSEADNMVDAYAEDLMDEVFEDVDRILAGEDSAIYADPEVTSKESYASLSSAAVTVPAMIVPVTATRQAVEASPQSPITERAADSKDNEPQDLTNKRPNRKRLRNWLLGAVCLSALAGAGVWFMRQQSAVQPAPTTVAPTPAPVSEDAAFRDYLTRSLRVISGERTAQTETQNSNTTVATSPNQATDSQAATGRTSTNVIERVFVPLLQPGSSVNQRTPSGVVTSPTLPTPNGTGQTESAAPVPNISAANTYELVGVLELGDRSAALFEINGSSQRVYIGETIGGSGWSIVSINNEEVVVRRNGEVRSIYIGQQF